MGLNHLDQIESEGEEKILAEINMTPLIDIMLVLLIIFMVTSSVALNSGSDIDLPESKSKAERQEENPLIISLDKRGKISIQGTELADINQLGARLKDALKKVPNGTVVFEGDKSSRLGRMVEIMDIAKSSGARKFVIATEDQ